MRKSLLAVAAIAALSSPVQAQVQITMYPYYPGSTNPAAPFNGGSPLCTATIGGPSGFTAAFGNAAQRSAICPGNPGRIDPSYNIFGARITGYLWASVAGNYQLDFSADDGDVLMVNNIIYDYEWNNVKGGGPGDVWVDLNVGRNDFVIDYNNSWYGGGFVRFNESSNDVAFVTPEPGSLALMGTGLFAVVGAGWRKRRQVGSSAANA